MSNKTLTSNSHNSAPPPFSFAQAASKAPSKAPVEKAVPHPSSSSTLNASSDLPQLKRWPKTADPKVLKKYLEETLKDKDHLILFKEISAITDGKTKILILMRGVSGSGKSVLATLLAGVSENGIILSADHHFTDARGVYRFDHNELGSAHGGVQKKCKAALAAEKSPIIIDNTNTMTKEMIPYVKMAIKFSYEVRLVEPKTNWKTNAKMLAQKNVHGVPFPKIKQMMERYETGITPEKLIREAKQELKKEDQLLASLGRLKLN